MYRRETAFQEVTSDVIPLVFVLFVPSTPFPLPSASAGTPVASDQDSWTSNAPEASPLQAGGPQLHIRCVHVVWSASIHKRMATPLASVGCLIQPALSQLYQTFLR